MSTCNNITVDMTNVTPFTANIITGEPGSDGQDGEWGSITGSIGDQTDLNEGFLKTDGSNANQDINISDGYDVILLGDGSGVPYVRIFQMDYRDGDYSNADYSIYGDNSIVFGDVSYTTGGGFDWGDSWRIARDDGGDLEFVNIAGDKSVIFYDNVNMDTLTTTGDINTIGVVAEDTGAGTIVKLLNHADSELFNGSYGDGKQIIFGTSVLGQFVDGIYTSELIDGSSAAHFSDGSNEVYICNTVGIEMLGDIKLVGDNNKIYFGQEGDATLTWDSAKFVLDAKAADLAQLADQPTGGTDLAIATTKYVNDNMSSGASVSFGLPNEIPFVNAGSSDFNYSGSLTFSGASLVLSGNQVANNLELKQHAYFTSEYDNGNLSGAVAVDWGNGNKQRGTLSGNSTLSFTAPDGVGNFLLKVVQDDVGSRTITWPGSVLWPAGSAVTLTQGAASTDIITFYYDGSKYYGQGGLDFQ